MCCLAGFVPDMPDTSIDLTVARGLDYYTGMVFEFEVDELGERPRFSAAVPID